MQGTNAMEQSGRCCDERVRGGEDVSIEWRGVHRRRPAHGCLAGAVRSPRAEKWKERRVRARVKDKK
jgi:hypothetical protein